jgi:hypothetical protein
MSDSALRNFSTTQIEQAIAKAMGDLAGGEFTVRISAKKYSAPEMSQLTGKAEKVDLTISVVQKPAPLNIVIDLTEPDGTVSAQMHVDPK